MTPFGVNNSPPSIIGFDYSVLGSYYASGANQRVSASGATLSAAARDPDLIPPWLQRPARDGASDTQNILTSILSSKPLLDFDDPRLARAGGDEDFKELFSAYLALDRMRELTSFAMTPAASTSLTVLNNRFGNWLEELKPFVDNLHFPGMNVLYGVRDAEAGSSMVLPRTTDKILPEHKGASISEVREDPIAGLTGSETFTLRVNQSGSEKVLAMDLSAVSGTLNVDNIVTYLNGELLSNGVASSFEVERYNENSYGLKLNVGSGETVTFENPSDTSAAVYLAGGLTGGTTDGFVKKYDNLGAASPDAVFQTAIATEESDVARDVATDSQGNVYVVGTTAGDLGGELNHQSDDVYLQKFDASGQLVFSRLLGAASSAQGFSLAVDGSDNVVIAGQTRDILSDTAFGGGTDSFVTKFNSAGEEQWTRQAAPYADDAALSVSTDASGNVFIAGYARGAVGAGASHAGGTDAYVSKLDADGALVWNKQFGGANDDMAKAVKVDASGNIFVAAEVDGDLVVRKYADDASQDPTWEENLGALGSEGRVGDLALGQSGAVYVVGATTNAALSGTVNVAHSGGLDGFVAQLTDNGASATNGFVSYLGDTGSDFANALAVDTSGASDTLYLTGTTDGAIGGATSVGEQDGFLVQMDNAGAIASATQFGGGFAYASNSIALDTAGTDVLSRLGLGEGTWPQDPPIYVSDATSARPGQSFTIAVNGGSPQTITLEQGDSLGFLSFKINKVLGSAGRAEFEDKFDGRHFRIEARNGAKLEISGGPEGFDLLRSLGLNETILHAELSESDQALIEQGDLDEEPFFELGLFTTVQITDAKSAEEANILVENAMKEIRQAYEFFNFGPEEESNPAAQISAEDAKKIASMEAILAQVTSLARNGASLGSVLA